MRSNQEISRLPIDRNEVIRIHKEWERLWKGPFLESVLWLRHLGVSEEVISKRFGVTSRTVFRWLKEAKNGR